MPITLPPSPPPAMLIAEGMLMAEGSAPRWRLTEVAGRWQLTIEGQSPIAATMIGHRFTRQGTVIGARRDDGGIISITVNPGLCRRGAERPTAHHATLSIDRLTLSGCYVAKVPGERPVND